MYASDPALQRASAAMTAATLAAGLLTTSTYQAMYVPYVTSSDSAQPASDFRHQMQQPIVHSARAYSAFRALNAMAFAASVLCVAFATFVLWQISTRGTYRPLLFRCAFGGLLVALFASVGAALCGVLSFVDFSAGIVGSVFTGIVIVALFVGFGACIGVHPLQGRAPQHGQTIESGKPVLPGKAAEIKPSRWSQPMCGCEVCGGCVSFYSSSIDGEQATGFLCCTSIVAIYQQSVMSTDTQ